LNELVKQKEFKESLELCSFLEIAKFGQPKVENLMDSVDLSWKGMGIDYSELHRKLQSSSIIS